VYRYVPIHNEMVNGHWMCDSGRNSYHSYMNPLRVTSPLMKHNGELHATSIETLLTEVKAQLKNVTTVQIVIGTDATREEAALLKDKVPALIGKNVTVSYFNNLLKMKDLTPNTRGVEEQGLVALANGEISADVVIYFRSGRAGIPKMKADQKIILWGVWSLEEIKSLPSKNILAVIAGHATIEKAGSYKNADGIVQKFHPAIIHRGGALSAHQVVGVWQSLT
jgi:NADH-quinone oxidoreductase subunit G